MLTSKTQKNFHRRSQSKRIAVSYREGAGKREWFARLSSQTQTGARDWLVLCDSPFLAHRSIDGYQLRPDRRIRLINKPPEFSFKRWSRTVNSQVKIVCLEFPISIL